MPTMSNYRRRKSLRKSREEATVSLCREQKYQKLLDLLGVKRKVLWQDQRGRLEGAYLTIKRVGHGLGKGYDSIAYVWLGNKSMTIQIRIDSIRSVSGEW